MNLVAALHNAQSRPAEEARRVTEALGAAFTGSDGFPGTEAVEEALRTANQQIADEKSRRFTPEVRSGHLEEFADGAESGDVHGFADSDATPDPEPSPPADDQLAAGVGAQGETGEQDAAQDGAPTARSDDENESYLDDDIGLGGHFDSSGDSDDDDDGCGGADGGDHESAPPGEVPVQLPSPTDSYAAVASPWGDAPEIVTSTADVGSSDDGDDGDDDALDGDAQIPSSRATDPPEDFVLPEPDRGPSLAQRLRERVEGITVAGSRGRKVLLISLAVIAVVAIISVIAVFSLSGNRGTPPDPAVVLPPAPTQSDTPEAPADTGVLVPSTVSASCGNDSDPVAPFAGEKSRAWVCNRLHGLDLNVLNITFNKPVVITEITIVPGFNYVAPDGRDEWSRHRLITGVTWRMGGSVYPQTINPTRTGVTKQFPSVRTTQLSMTITSSTRPPMGADQRATIGAADDAANVDDSTAVSRIVITGYPVDPGS